MSPKSNDRLPASFFKRFKHYMTARRPKTRYTVSLECWDPPNPCFTAATDSSEEALYLYANLVGEEIRECGGGEFIITLWSHDLDKNGFGPKPKVMYDDDGVLYHMSYPGSQRLMEFCYMELVDRGRPIAVVPYGC